MIGIGRPQWYVAYTVGCKYVHVRSRGGHNTQNFLWPSTLSPMTFDNLAVELVPPKGAGSHVSPVKAFVTGIKI